MEFFRDPFGIIALFFGWIFSEDFGIHTAISRRVISEAIQRMFAKVQTAVTEFCFQLLMG